MQSIKPAAPVVGGLALSIALLLDHQTAYAQAQAGAAAAPATGSEDVTTIVVTGTRITSSFAAPTPISVLTAEDLQKSAEPNIFNSIRLLPALLGSTGVTVNTFSTSSGQQGLSSFALRGLNPIRTLTLLDGQRVVPANVTGVPDISQFPQLLVKRVDVVTGGASASYGSDAVGGVINFVTDKRFQGVKAEASGGITTYGDDGQYRIGLAAGDAYFGNRLHLETSIEYEHEDGVPPGGFGEHAPDGRTWFRATTLVDNGSNSVGVPRYVYANDAQAYQYALYGLITAGPLQGTAFNAAGNPYPFLYGSNGVPAKNAAGTVIGCYVGFCVGGDNAGAVGIGASLQSSITRRDGYGRIGFSLDDSNEIYATINVARVESSNQPNPGASRSGLTISCANAYVPAAIQTACTNDGITSFQFGTDNAILPNPLVRPTRQQQRFVLGAEGELRLAGTGWHYDAYYEHGENTTDVIVSTIPLTPHYNQAINAISLNGQIVCANATARANGCVPIDVFGDVTPSAATLAYIDPTNGPFQHTIQKQDAASLAINGDPFSLWAGPVSLAFGAEWRNEFYHVTADPYGNGVSTGSPYSAAYPADPTVSTTGSAWYAGNYHDGSGEYHVTEAFLETNVPFLSSESLGKANVNVAGRWTDYSTSGVLYTWKIGGTWQTPYSPLRLRAMLSHDVRAPNLSELFAAPVATTIPNFTNPFNNTQLLIIQNVVGNTALEPEKARNLELGVVLANPDFLHGFSASVDYYKITVDGVVSSLTAQQQVNFCFAGLTQYCSTFNLAPASGTPYVNVQQFNLASIYTNGFDLEASYQLDLAKLHAPGALSFRALATHVINFISNPGITGTVPTQLAGANTGGTPYWKLYATQTWDLHRFGVDLTERWISDGVFGHQYVVCQANCPATTVNNPTINYDTMAGAFYLDLGVRYNVSDHLSAFLKIDNLMDRDPTPAPQTNTGLDTNPALYDIVGRTYRAGVRVSF
jgi:outer membrane receptor protein involved in Fe transport